MLEIFVEPVINSYIFIKVCRFVYVWMVASVQGSMAERWHDEWGASCL
jgi:hypothetical protein